MSKGNDGWDILGMLCIMGTGVPLGMTSMYGSSSGTLNDASGGDFSEPLVASSESFSEAPGALSALTTVGGTTIVSAMTFDGGPDAVIEVFFKNQVPYTAIEKRAEQVYGTLHGTGRNVLEKTALIVESGEATETVCKAFCGARGESVLDQLELFEELLESVADNQNVS